MTCKDELTKAMTALGQDPLTRFIGYGVTIGKAGGTLSGVPEAQLIETPVAENLMVGVAIGLSLKGYKPIVYFERMDFILNAMDAIVNHLDKIKQLSGGEYAPTMILRCVVGNTAKPLYTGATHTQNFTEAIRKMVSFPVQPLTRAEWIGDLYQTAHLELAEHSTMLVEYKDLL